MRRLHEALGGVSERAPHVYVAPGFYRSARRRHRLRLVGAVVSVVALVALVAPATIVIGRTSGGIGDGGVGPPGIPDRITTPPWSTETVSGAPPGPASVVFSGDVPQADHEDVDLAWWRPGYTVYPSVVVGLRADTYRIVRGPYGVGTELSPDGRHLLMPDRQVLDLTTGTTRRLRPPNPRWEVQGSWSADGKRALYVEDRVTTVLSWPSLATEATFRHQDHVPVDQDVALSTDGRLLAVNSNQLLSVYRSDGTRAWSAGEEAQPTLGRVRIGGRAAWHADGRLTVFARTDLVCEVCGQHPGTWRLRFVDGATGVPVPGAEYPPVRSAIGVNVVAWRGDVAYAVVAAYHGDAAETADVGYPDRIELVRLRPGAPAPEPLLTAPDGTTWLGVATEFLDASRPAGTADYGFNRRELMGRVVTGAACLAPFLIGLGVVVVTRLRRRRTRPAGDRATG